MEVIHRYKGFYPFSLEHNSHTFLEVLLENLSEQQMVQCKRHYKVMKDQTSATLVKLVKIYKEDCNLHLLYEYLPFSLEHFLHNNQRNPKQIYTHLVDSINNIVEALVSLQVKTDFFIQSIVVTDLQTGQLKLFIDPNAEFTGTNFQENTKDKVSSASIAQNKQNLHYFYETEKKRVVMEIEELLQKHYGASCINAEVNCPNFVISGSKLVFINRADHNGFEKKREVGKSPLRNGKECFKRELKQKNLKKIEEIKNVLSKLQTKHHSPHDCKIYPETADDIVFRPEQITNDKTAVLQENQYLESLESELEKFHQEKAKPARGSSEEKRNEMIKQISELQERSRNDHSSNSDQIVPRLSEKKSDKPNKYKMKITTSHQIEIQGKGEPQNKMADQEAIQEVRSGKITLSQLSQKQARPKTVKLGPQQQRAIEARQQKAQEIMLNTRNSDIASKTNKINEIIEKINSKTNINTLSSCAHQQEQKTEPPQHCRNDEPHTDNYMQKIRQAKHKAEQVLKEYKKKH